MISVLPIPTPWAVGDVNCYLVEDDPLTLVDVGPNWGIALEALEHRLREHGHAIEDLQRIVITHEHPDHEGLLGVLQRRSGAETVALDRLATILADWDGDARADDAHATALMRRHGIADDVVTALGGAAMGLRALGGSGTIDTTVSDGDELHFRDRTWTVLHRPGHSPTDTVFHDRERREAIGGDHLLGHISSNPIASRHQAQALVSYLRSMRATQAMEDLDTILPGHGDVVTNPREVIETRFKMHDRRAGKIGAMLDGGPITAHEIARQMWGKASLTQPFLTLSEVLGHLDLLVERGEAHAVDDGELTKFAR